MVRSRLEALRLMSYVRLPRNKAGEIPRNKAGKFYVGKHPRPWQGGGETGDGMKQDWLWKKQAYYVLDCWMFGLDILVLSLPRFTLGNFSGKAYQSKVSKSKGFRIGMDWGDWYNIACYSISLTSWYEGRWLLSMGALGLAWVEFQGESVRWIETECKI